MKKRRNQFKIGDIVTVKSHGNGHNYTIGNTYKVAVENGGSYQLEDIDTHIRGNWITADNMEISKRTIEEFEGSIKHLQKEISKLQEKIDWMNEAGLTEYNETEHRAWKLISTVEDNDLSKIDKVKLISSLLK